MNNTVSFVVRTRDTLHTRVLGPYYQPLPTLL